MRELQIGVPKARSPQPITRLDFAPSGAELVVQLDDRLRVCDLRSGAVGPLFSEYQSDLSQEFLNGFALSPDKRLLALYNSFDLDTWTTFEEPPGREYQLPPIESAEPGPACLMFAPAGDELIAVRNRWGVTDVARLPLATIFAPKRFVEKINPLNGKSYKRPATLPKWKPLLELPRGEVATAAALSASGRLLAAGTEGGAVHVADLKTKALAASFPWTGRKLRDRAVRRVGFDPAARWVVLLAVGRLFAHPLGTGTPWRTPESLGRIHDVAFHPGGKVLCAACEDGQARFLDPLTGKVRQAFKWSKRPKPLHSVCFAPDGLTCAAGTADGKVIVWDVDV